MLTIQTLFYKESHYHKYKKIVFLVSNCKGLTLLNVFSQHWFIFFLCCGNRIISLHLNYTDLFRHFFGNHCQSSQFREQGSMLNSFLLPWWGQLFWFLLALPKCSLAQPQKKKRKKKKKKLLFCHFCKMLLPKCSKHPFSLALKLKAVPCLNVFHYSLFSSHNQVILLMHQYSQHLIR